jgi:hypothetical protein
LSYDNEPLDDASTAVMGEALRRNGIDTAPKRPGDDDPREQFFYDQIDAVPGGWARIERALRRFGSVGADMALRRKREQ